MAANDTEIEIKVKVENVESLISFLKNNGKFIKEERQVDEYFSPAHRNFLDIRPVKEWLRLREENGKFSLNYKNWHFDTEGKGSSCDEFETSFEKIEQVRKMFDTLNFHSLTKVDKTRKSWNYKNYEISVDSVANLGNFVEIEFNGMADDHKKITDEMVQFLKEMNVGKIQRNFQGYPFLLLFPEEAKYFEV